MDIFVVIADAKILILKQITTKFWFEPIFAGCYCRCKDTNFKANHNRRVIASRIPPVVIADAKILILKQITTNALKYYASFRCYCRCKDTNFKANHNSNKLLFFFLYVVIADAKILILKQITTTFRVGTSDDRLLLQMQRY